MEFTEEEIKKWEKVHKRGKAAGGLLIAAIGGLFLAREMGAEMPNWLFSWKTLLIGIGIVGLIKHGFQRLGWMIPIIIGSAFLMVDFFPDLTIKPVLWPIVLIIVGLFIAFKPRRRNHWHNRQRWERRYHRRYRHDKYAYDCQPETTNPTNEDFIESTSVMGGLQKKIISKKFRGGDITNVFGGTELDLTQADIEGKVTLELTQVFGGIKLIVPSHWQVQTSMETVIGSVEDKRPISPQTNTESEKTLVLTGTIVCGGVEITTY